MFRYLRLYGYFVRFSFSRAMEFRFDFFFRVFMDLVYYTVNILFYKIVFLHTGVLGGWNENQMMVFVACYLVVDAVNMTVFMNNTWMLPTFINRGDLDYYLTRPVAALFFVSLRDFAANSFLNLLASIGILVWALSEYEGVIDFPRLALLACLLLNGAVLNYLTRMLTVIPVFWMHSGRGLESVYWTMSRFMERPDGIFSGWTRRLLLSLLPFGLMASFPARLFIESFSWLIFLNILIVSVLYFAGVVFFWRAGLRAYSSASS